MEAHLPGGSAQLGQSELTALTMEAMGDAREMAQLVIRFWQ